MKYETKQYLKEHWFTILQTFGWAFIMVILITTSKQLNLNMLYIGIVALMFLQRNLNILDKKIL